MGESQLAATEVAFGGSYVDTSYKLFELDEPILQELLRSEDRWPQPHNPSAPQVSPCFSAQHLDQRWAHR